MADGIGAAAVGLEEVVGVDEPQAVEAREAAGDRGLAGRGRAAEPEDGWAHGRRSTSLPRACPDSLDLVGARRVGPVEDLGDDRAQAPQLDEAAERREPFGVRPHDDEARPLPVAGEATERRQHRPAEDHGAAAGGDPDAAAGGEERLALLVGRAPGGIEDDLVGGVVPDPVLLLVVDRPLGPELPHEALVAPARHGGDPGAEGGGDLDREVTDAAGGAHDERALARLELAELHQRLQGGQARERQGRGLLPGEPRRLGRGARLGGERPLGVAAAARRAEVGHDRIARRERRDLGAHGLDLAGDVAAEHQREAAGADEPQPAAAHLPVDRVDAGRAHPHEHLPGAGLGPRHLGEVEPLRPAVAVDDHRAHGGRRG